MARKQLDRDPQPEPVRPSVVGLPRRGPAWLLAIVPRSTIRAASAALFSSSSSSLLPLSLRPLPRQLSEYGWRPIQPSAGFAGHLEIGADSWQAGKGTTPVPGRACRSTWLLRRNSQAIASLVCIGMALEPWGATDMGVGVGLNGKDQGARPKRQARDPDRHIGARIRERRIMLGLSQQAFAQRIGVTHKQVGKYEHAALEPVSAVRSPRFGRRLSTGNTDRAFVAATRTDPTQPPARRPRWPARRPGCGQARTARPAAWGP